MKFWPQNKWKQILLAFFLAVIGVSAILGIFVGFTSTPYRTAPLNTPPTECVLNIYKMKVFGGVQK